MGTLIAMFSNQSTIVCNIPVLGIGVPENKWAGVEVTSAWVGSLPLKKKSEQKLPLIEIAWSRKKNSVILAGMVSHGYSSLSTGEGKAGEWLWVQGLRQA